MKPLEAFLYFLSSQGTLSKSYGLDALQALAGRDGEEQGGDVHDALRGLRLLGCL